MGFSRVRGKTGGRRMTGVVSIGSHISQGGAWIATVTIANDLLDTAQLRLGDRVALFSGDGAETGIFRVSPCGEGVTLKGHSPHHALFITVSGNALERLGFVVPERTVRYDAKVINGGIQFRLPISTPRIAEAAA